jgi:hypothetical protein
MKKVNFSEDVAITISFKDFNKFLIIFYKNLTVFSTKHQILEIKIFGHIEKLKFFGF